MACSRCGAETDETKAGQDPCNSCLEVDIKKLEDQIRERNRQEEEDKKQETEAEKQERADQEKRRKYQEAKIRQNVESQRIAAKVTHQEAILDYLEETVDLPRSEKLMAWVARLDRVKYQNKIRRTAKDLLVLCGQILRSPKKWPDPDVAERTKRLLAGDLSHVDFVISLFTWKEEPENGFYVVASRIDKKFVEENREVLREAIRDGSL